MGLCHLSWPSSHQANRKKPVSPRALGSPAGSPFRLKGKENFSLDRCLGITQSNNHLLSQIVKLRPSKRKVLAQGPQ